MPTLKIKISAEWKHDYTQDDLLELVDREDDEKEPTKQELDDALSQYIENLRSEIVDDVYSYIHTDLDVEITDV